MREKPVWCATRRPGTNFLVHGSEKVVKCKSSRMIRDGGRDVVGKAEADQANLGDSFRRECQGKRCPQRPFRLPYCCTRELKHYYVHRAYVTDQLTFVPLEFCF